jgi:hypothetical protein
MTLGATTLVSTDITSLFANSKVGEVFSAAGVSAFLSFPFEKSVIFYIFLVKTGVLIYFMYTGYKQDKKNGPKFMQKLQVLCSR